jgi:CheY-like chemotaxis protein
LRAGGYAVEQAANGREALHCLLRGPLPDLILLDLEMPVLDGPGFRREQTRTPGLGAIPVLVVSGAADGERIAARMGAAGFVRKPATYGELLDAVHRCVRPARAWAAS